MEIKCVASIYDAYYKVVEVSVGKSRRRKVVKVSSRNNNKYTYLTKNSENNSGSFLIFISMCKIYHFSVFLVAVWYSLDYPQMRAIKSMLSLK